MSTLLIAIVVVIYCMRSRRRKECGEDVVDISEGGADGCTASMSHSDLRVYGAAVGCDAPAVPATLVPASVQVPATPFSAVSKEDEARTAGMSASVHVAISTSHHDAFAALPGPLRSDVGANSDPWFGPGNVLRVPDAQATRSSIRVVLVCSASAGPAAARDSLSDSGGTSLYRSAAPGATTILQDALDSEVQKQSADAVEPRNSGVALGSHGRTPTRLRPERRSSFDGDASRLESYSRDPTLARRRASAANLAAASLWMAGSTGRVSEDPVPPQTSGRIPGQV